MPIKRIGITMRMVKSGFRKELRNELAHDWTIFLSRVLKQTTFIPVPNIGQSVIKQWVESLNLEGIILTGGDDWGIFPLRDETERTLCLWAIENNLPLLGVCRGMQVLNHVLGGKLPSQEKGGISSQTHVGTYHNVYIANEYLAVNSFHTGILENKDISSDLSVWAIAEDNSIEAVRTQNRLAYGIMWHPEREKAPQIIDLTIFNKLFVQS
ncbi:putative Peptidase C26 [Desulfamplus magnetovallimortis]|uniref:Putative Peptidase C26 n=1 Tax=Desulfamplus magnetovallimortis TaxID=1246637 RepID=A0A1W1HEW0_9BACT|nr:gamma-glutamyl-gamma-aminobutyrate hydrolase family protein [Desulfamplus magnetovallimortis]SLM30915.1 putative Peptidase C26 [Desulfamplus magnetovallimortis]